MLSQKLTRITLKMSDFEEYEQVKREREKAMDTSQPAPHPEGNGKTAKTPKSTPLTQDRRGPVRASTPDSPRY